MKIRYTYLRNGLLVSACILFSLTGAYAQGFENFISVSGNQLMDGDKAFRFISFNVPTLNYQEDEMAFSLTNPYRLPDEFEMRDVFETVKEMGGQVIRIYTIPVRNKNFPDEAPTYVESPGQFNEEAFKVTDMMLSLANEYEIRIIFSLLNNWQWMGGRPNYADFRGKTQDEFWTDPQLIEDFKQTVNHVINRKNTISHINYKDDKAILCWETGNELQSPFEWTRTITRYIKSLDENHLVLDGYYAIDDRTVLEEALLEPSIDLVSSHHYEKNPIDIPKHIRKNIKVIKGRKPYLVGEFGFASTTGLELVLNEVISNEDVCGALIWSLRFHRREGGFYWHSEPMGSGIYKAYHWPGFKSGESYDEIGLMKMMRQKAFEIQGKETPTVNAPERPLLLPIGNAYSISWQGSMGASSYDVERAESERGPWHLVGYNISDANVPYFPLFHDETAQIGKSYYYRIKAKNSAGISKESNAVGPVKIKEKALIDRMKNYGMLYHSEGVKPVTGSDRDYKEIIHRLQGDSGAAIVYFIPGFFKQFSIYSFERAPAAQLRIESSVDGEEWNSLELEPASFVNSESNYNYLVPRIYNYHKSGEIKYIKIVFKGLVDLGRVELLYTN